MNDAPLDTDTYERLIGVEVEPFSRELAKLQLTLADVPHGNSWHIDEMDMFMPGVLAERSSACTLLLANPPYEAFTPPEKTRLRRGGEEVTAITKAVEMLKRTLPHLPPGAVFGVVLPLGFLHDRESRPIREFLLNECEISEIDVFADKLFEHGEHEVTVLLGRRRHAGKKNGFVMYRRVRESGMAAFKGRMAFSSEWRVPRARFSSSPELTLMLRIWWRCGITSLRHRYSARRSTFRKAANTGKKGNSRPAALTAKKRPGWIQAILKELVSIGSGSFLEPSGWIRPEILIRSRGGGALPGTPQVVLNYARVSRDPWRLKAVIDERGLAVASRMIVFRPKSGGPSLALLWAVVKLTYRQCLRVLRLEHASDTCQGMACFSVSVRDRRTRPRDRSRGECIFESCSRGRTPSCNQGTRKRVGQSLLRLTRRCSRSTTCLRVLNANCSISSPASNVKVSAAVFEVTIQRA